MYYLISILLIIAAIGLAVYGVKKYNLSLALSYVIPNLAFLYYIDAAFDGVPYIKYGYYAVLIFGLLIFLFAKIFTYIYAYFTLLFLIVLIWASFYSMFNFNTENLSSIESWTIILLAVVILVLVRKSIKGLVIGMGSGFMLGIGVAALGFKSILNMGWGYIMDAIYLPGLTILLFTFAGISYQYYVNKSAEENPDIPKKQVNLYFGSGSAIIAVLLILLPLLLTTTPEKSAKKLAKAYCKCANKVLDSDNLLDIEEICKDKIGFSDSVKSISSIDDVQVFSSVFAIEISSCMNDIATNLERKVNKPKETKKETQSNQRNTIKETEKQTQSDQLYGNNENYDKFLGRYIGDFGMDRAILAIENIDTQNGLATGYLKTLGEYEESLTLEGPFKAFNDNELRLGMSDGYTTYDFYVNGRVIEGDAKSQIGETMYSFSLSKMENSSSNESSKKTYYTIQDVDGYSNLRNRPNGEILKRVYESEIFEVIGSEAKHKKVKLKDGTIGYIHESRVVKVNSDNTQYNSSNQNNKSVLLQTTKYKIRIDNLGNGNYTYTAWPASSAMNDTPNIVIKNGKRYEDGSGGNHYYTFTNGNYKYKCSINVLGTDETPPANLLVYNNDDLILSQDALIK